MCSCKDCKEKIKRLEQALAVSQFNRELFEQYFKEQSAILLELRDKLNERG